MFTVSKTISRLQVAIFTGAMLLLPGILLAQDEACQGQDPTGNTTTCPLDTWVWVLVTAAAILGTIKLSANRNMPGRFI